MVSLASEFPNDNPALHEGAVWVCLAPTGPAVVEHPRSRCPVSGPVVSDVDDDDASIVVEELEPIDAALEGIEPEPLPEEIAPALTGELPIEALVEPARAPASDVTELVEDEIEAPPESGTVVADPFAVFLRTLAEVAASSGAPRLGAVLPDVLEAMPVARAWREILRGTSDDFAACGSAMLDEWASEVLAGLLEEPGRAPMLRQELRSRGIAAFGLAA